MTFLSRYRLHLCRKTQPIPSLLHDMNFNRPFAMRHKILPFFDFALIHICFLICNFLLQIEIYQASGALVFGGIFILCCKFAGFYEIALRYIGILSLKISVFSATIALFVVFLTHGADLVGLYVFFALTSINAVVFSRIVVREFYFLSRHANSTNTLVYGAGSISWSTICYRVIAG